MLALRLRHFLLSGLAGLTSFASAGSLANFWNSSDFSIDDRSIWGASGASRIEKNYFAGTSWNTSGGGGSFTGTEPFRFGAGGGGSTRGRVGIGFDLRADQGSLSSQLPLVVQFDMVSNTDSLRSGSVVTVKPIFVGDSGGGGFHTTSPNFGFRSNLVLDIYADVYAQLCVFGCVGFDRTPIINTSAWKGFGGQPLLPLELVAFNYGVADPVNVPFDNQIRLLGSDGKFLFPKFGFAGQLLSKLGQEIPLYKSAFTKQPIISIAYLADKLVPTIETFGETTSSGRVDLFKVALDVTQALVDLSWRAGFPIPPLAGSLSTLLSHPALDIMKTLPGFVQDVVDNIGYNLLTVRAATTAGFQQDFAMSKPNVVMNLKLEETGDVFRVPLSGESQFTIPKLPGSLLSDPLKSSLTFTPTFEVTSQFTNKTSMFIDPSLEASALGLSFGSYSTGNLWELNPPLRFQTPPIEVFKTSFNLDWAPGGWDPGSPLTIALDKSQSAMDLAGVLPSSLTNTAGTLTSDLSTGGGAFGAIAEAFGAAKSPSQVSAGGGVGVFGTTILDGSTLDGPFTLSVSNTVELHNGSAIRTSVLAIGPTPSQPLAPVGVIAIYDGTLGGTPGQMQSIRGNGVINILGNGVIENVSISAPSAPSVLVETGATATIRNAPEFHASVENRGTLNTFGDVGTIEPGSLLNSGTLNVRTGTLVTSSLGQTASAFTNVASGATLLLSGESMCTSCAPGTYASMILDAGATVEMRGAAGPASLTQFSVLGPGRFVAGAGPHSSLLQNSVLDGLADISIQGSVEFSNSAIYQYRDPASPDMSPTMVIENGGTATLNSSTASMLGSAYIENRGTLTVRGDSSLKGTDPRAFALYQKYGRTEVEALSTFTVDNTRFLSDDSYLGVYGIMRTTGDGLVHIRNFEGLNPVDMDITGGFDGELYIENGTVLYRGSQLTGRVTNKAGTFVKTTGGATAIQYRQGAGGTLFLDGGSFWQNDGSMELNGTLRMCFYGATWQGCSIDFASLVEGFTIPVLGYLSRSGQFSTIDVPGLSGFFWFADYQSNGLFLRFRSLSTSTDPNHALLTAGGEPTEFGRQIEGLLPPAKTPPGLTSPTIIINGAVPEPSTWVLLGTGTLLLLLKARRINRKG